MRPMNPEEIQETLSIGNWASICTVGPNGFPHAIEATPFVDDAQCLCFMINPRGTTLKNIENNPNVLLKFTLTTPDLGRWIGVSCFGKGRVERDPSALARGWELLGRVMDADYAKAAEKFSPMLVVAVDRMTGRCNYKRDESIDFSLWHR